MFLYNMQSYNNTNANACAMIGLTHFAMLPCSSYSTDCPTTEYTVSRYFLIAEESCEHQRGQWLGGSRYGVQSPPKINLSPQHST